MSKELEETFLQSRCTNGQQHLGRRGGNKTTKKPHVAPTKTDGCKQKELV